jgi:hypothetical protein
MTCRNPMCEHFLEAAAVVEVADTPERQAKESRKQ